MTEGALGGRREGIDWRSEAVPAGGGRLALAWSGGKDSALALWELRRSGAQPAVLMTTVEEGTGRVPHHGVDLELLRAQAHSARLELVAVEIPANAPNTAYEARLREAFAHPPLDAVATVAFGDLYLADLRAYREQQLGKAGIGARFPLWGRDTRRLAREFIAAGFRATIVSVDGDQLPHDFLGRRFDDRLLADLPAGADPCGERGEFHTFVEDGPVFARPIPTARGAATSEGRFAHLALGLTDAARDALPRAGAGRSVCEDRSCMEER